jgi:hypothetical protein
MQFTKKLRPFIKNGDVTTSIRVWKKPRVKVGGRYKLDEGVVIVTSIQEISFSDITENLAKESGFTCMADLIKTAKHGKGQTFYFIKLYYQQLPT